MSIHVTLHVFSGREDPSWMLTDSQERDLFRRLNAITTYTREKPSGVFGRLGFRGFSLSRPVDAARGPLNLFVHEGIVDRGKQEENFDMSNRDLERWLLETEPRILSAEVRRHVEDQLRIAPLLPDLYAANRLIGASCPPCLANDAPGYAPGTWNVPAVQPYNNCYNYANDQQTNTFAEPGRANGAAPASMDCANVNGAAQADGLIDSPGFSSALGAGLGWYAALVVWPGNDYHWYRQDSAGCWSHKPGATAVRDVDNVGNQIVDPSVCDRGPYSGFCGYMITNSLVTIG